VTFDKRSHKNLIIHAQLGQRGQLKIAINGNAGFNNLPFRFKLDIIKLGWHRAGPGIFFRHIPQLYSDCQKNVPFAEGFLLQALMPPSF
jgi:hypothetical protein